ncbi:hypothetical protein L1887_32408 [Cichorium endivia]|nr:hypothetical protein L1887_32408 [Cichorium endivia]
MVKDEGWIDELGDEENNSEDGSSPYTSEEEEDWSDDLSDIKSVDCKSEEEDWLKEDFPAEVEEEPQQSARSGLGGTRPNENIESQFKENNDYYEEGVYNSREEVNGQGEAHDDHMLSGYSGLEPFGEKIPENITQKNTVKDTEGNRNKKSLNLKTGSQEKDICRNAKMWDGGMSMRLFNKLVRDKSRRRGMFSDKARRSEKTAACLKSSYSGRGSKSRNSTELSEAKPGEDVADSLSLRTLGSQIGFTWGSDVKHGEGVATEAARVEEPL